MTIFEDIVLQNAQSWQCYIDVKYKTTNFEMSHSQSFLCRVIIASSESIRRLKESNTVNLVLAALQSVSEMERKKSNKSIRVGSLKCWTFY